MHQSYIQWSVTATVHLLMIQWPVVDSSDVHQDLDVTKSRFCWILSDMASTFQWKDDTHVPHTHLNGLKSGYHHHHHHHHHHPGFRSWKQPQVMAGALRNYARLQKFCLTSNLGCYTQIQDVILKSRMLYFKSRMLYFKSRMFVGSKKLPSRSLTFSPLKMDGWKTILSFWDGIFSGANC